MRFDFRAFIKDIGKGSKHGCRGFGIAEFPYMAICEVRWNHLARLRDGNEGKTARVPAREPLVISERLVAESERPSKGHLRGLRREIIDDDRIRVTFVETVFTVFGKEVKRQPTSGSGVWEQLYVERGLDGTAKLRVMRTCVNKAERLRILPRPCY